ncbi:hypothetical protein FA15DRAFT_671700 [Coprinopsis marcescibilis]|uniref:Uncharacterized protein n=1 Tax=Coprinopsis marcescibilis TaxID=230819 RepID=A0A5C3KNZ5_COPMA|nr:hypothetical protein FA15DRAFT_671700 [Coprinopsis marcescibilis]
MVFQTMPLLPAEIRLQITRFSANDDRTLAILARVERGLQNEAEKLLYHTVFVSKTPRALACLEAMVKSPRKAAMVRCARIEPSGCVNKEISFESTCAVLRQMHQLAHLDVEWNVEHEKLAPRDCLCRETFDRVIFSGSFRLKTLSYEGHYTDPSRIVFRHGPTLKTLGLYGSMDDDLLYGLHRLTTPKDEYACILKPLRPFLIQDPAHAPTIIFNVMPNSSWMDGGDASLELLPGVYPDQLENLCGAVKDHINAGHLFKTLPSRPTSEDINAISLYWIEPPLTAQYRLIAEEVRKHFPKVDTLRIHLQPALNGSIAYDEIRDAFSTIQDLESIAIDGWIHHIHQTQAYLGMSKEQEQRGAQEWREVFPKLSRVQFFGGGQWERGTDGEWKAPSE